MAGAQGGVMRFILFLALASLLSWSCQPKSTGDVFPESQSSLSSECLDMVVPQEYVVKDLQGNIFTVNADSDQDFISNFLKPNLATIEYAEYQKRIQLYQFTNTPNYHAQQLPGASWGQAMTKADSAWAQGVTGGGIRVAVIDTATDIQHPSLFSNILVNTSELNGQPGEDSDQNGLVDDVYGWDFYHDRPISFASEAHSHGTHVSGIIAGRPNAGWSGVAPDAKVLPISFMSNDGYGNTASAINSLKYARMRQVHIVNASWGGPICSKLLEQEIQNLAEADILFISASGNDGLDLDWQPQYPAAFNLPLQITVAATRASDFLAAFSNTSYQVVHLGAPGDSIWSTLPGGQFGYMTGTSMAAPFVSGAAALLWSKFPSATAAQIRTAILAGVDSKSYRVQTSGRLNIERSLGHLDDQFLD